MESLLLESWSRGLERASADHLLLALALRQEQFHLSPPHWRLFNISVDVSSEKSCNFSGICSREKFLFFFFLMSKLKLSLLQVKLFLLFLPL